MKIIKTKSMKTHKEKIICPICKTKQWAVVEHTLPFWNYTHTCIHCKYIIMESEWEQVDDVSNVEDAKKEAGCLVIILAILLIVLSILLITL